MGLRSLTAVLRMPHLKTTVQLSRDLRAMLRVHFLYAAQDAGLLRALRAPLGRAEALRAMGASRSDLAESLLDLGVSLGELSRRGDRYALRGERSRALAADDGDPLAAWLEENVAYHADVYLHLAERLRGGALGSYLDSMGTLIARSSRVLEPLIAGFARQVVSEHRPRRLLEVGCGSGVYLHHAALADPALSGVGIDLQQAVVAETRESLARWGIADRFQVIAGDVREPPAGLGGPFDLITLYNNLYYFPEAERPALFERLRSWLSRGGALALVSAFRGPAPETHNFDLVLRSTEGCTPLPDLRGTQEQLRAAGFAAVRATTLGPGGIAGVVASLRA